MPEILVAVVDTKGLKSVLLRRKFEKEANFLDLVWFKYIKILNNMILTI